MRARVRYMRGSQYPRDEISSVELEDDHGGARRAADVRRISVGELSPPPGTTHVIVLLWDEEKREKQNENVRTHFDGGRAAAKTQKQKPKPRRK